MAALDFIIPMLKNISKSLLVGVSNSRNVNNMANAVECSSSIDYPIHELGGLGVTFSG